jgi:hypothetical protein
MRKLEFLAVRSLHIPANDKKATIGETSTECLPLGRARV